MNDETDWIKEGQKKLWAHYMNPLPLTGEERKAIETRFDMEMWREEVIQDNTRLGYDDWVLHQVEANADPKAIFPGDEVLVNPSPLDLFGEFPGSVERFRPRAEGGWYVSVLDGDDNMWDCEPEQVEMIDTE